MRRIDTRYMNQHIHIFDGLIEMKKFWQFGLPYIFPPRTVGTRKEMKMNEEIRIQKLTDVESGDYLAEYSHLKGCMADGETKIEALEELEKAKDNWLLSAHEFGMEVPEKIKY